MRRLILTVFLAVLSPVSAFAQQTVKYDLSIRGIRVGTVTLASTESGGTYAVKGLATNSGITRIARRFSYTGDVRGRVSGHRFTPHHYAEVADTGKRVSEVELAYSGTVPRVVRYTSPKKAGPDSPAPATQGGTVDPLSAIYGLLRDIPANIACGQNFDIFDGKRRSRIRVKPAGMENGTPKCSGFYERMQGFLPDEVARHRRFDFTMTYEDAGDGRLMIDRVAFDSIYGKAVINRR